MRIGWRSGFTITLALFLTALALPTTMAEVHEVRTVRTGDDRAPFAFEPASLTIQVGDTVRFINGDGTFHTATSRGSNGAPNGEAFDLTLASEGDTGTHVFDAPGTFRYFCSPHASFMSGTITVVGSDVGQEASLSISLPYIGALVAAFALARRGHNP